MIFAIKMVVKKKLSLIKFYTYFFTYQMWVIRIIRVLVVFHDILENIIVHERLILF
jgi:hypothetical protein